MAKWYIWELPKTTEFPTDFLSRVFLISEGKFYLASLVLYLTSCDPG